MNENRRKIIVKEIEYWKQSHMLPEQYCNYLLALYTEGEGETQTDQKKHSILTRNAISYLIHLLILSISLFVIYFTELSFILQMGILTSLLVVSISLFFYYIRIRNKNHFAIISTLLLLLVTTVEAGSAVQAHKALVLYAITLVNCLLWMGLGKNLKLIYLSVSGVAGLILLVISIFV
ncbi:hypothetical protein SAMN04488577_1747 [Bacillus sp. cl95]|nr:hypothetical protein SAMN02799634_103114 [Bacillus sp. UNCCL13]SFQ79378.1 hypothetical protein SAMN04488577_1747 [Bacillus sp. cl95]